MARLYTISDTHREDSADLSEGTDLMRVKSVVCVPLIRKSKMRGLTYVVTVTKPNGFRRMGNNISGKGFVLSSFIARSVTT
jgi:hypothetical protein